MKTARILLALLAVCIGASASAQANRSATVKENRALVYHGKLVRPDGSVPDGSMAVTIQILSPDPKLCVLWKETQTVKLDNGAFSMEIGHSVNRVGGAVADFKLAFVNNPSSTPVAATCADGSTSYVPGASDDRLLSATFSDGGEVVEVAGLPIKSVPFALQAEEIAGFGIANLVKISGVGNNLVLSPLQVDELKAMSDTTLPFDMKTRQVKNAADPVDPQDLVTKAYYQAHLPTGTGVGSVTNVSVAGGALTVSSGTTTPLITLAQASGSVSGYLSSADWTTFNNKLSAVGLGDIKNGMGAAQFPSACAASQTMVWNAITDVLTCTNINNLDADKITAGTLATARLGAGVASSSTYLRGDQTWAALPPGADNLGDHTATTNLNLGAHQLVGNGGASGISVSATGNVGVGTASPGSRLEVAGGLRGGDGSAAAPTYSFTNGNGMGMYRFGAGQLAVQSGNGAQSLLIGSNYVQVPSNGQLRLGDGTAAIPGYSFYNDLTAGIFKPNTGVIAIATASSERLRIDGSGNVGIGTTSPAYKLDVAGHINSTGSVFSPNDTWMYSFAGGSAGQARSGINFLGSTAAIHFYTASSSRMKIDSSGNVGIGTSSPVEKFEVVGGKIKAPEYCIGGSCITAWPGGSGGSVTNVSSVNTDIGVTNGSTSPSLTLNSGTSGGAGDANKIAKLDAGGLLNVAMIPNFSAAKITSGTLAIAQGGTNSGATLNNNRLMISNGGAIVENAAITGNRALASNASGIPVASSVSDTELGYLSGVTSSLQTQLGNKQASNAELSGLAAIAATGIVQRTGAGTYTALGTTAPLTVTAGNLAMTFTPVNRAGDTMTGALNLPGNGLAVGTSQLVVSGGQVGVGTTSPGQKLDVVGTVKATAFQGDGSALTGVTAGAFSGTLGVANGGTGATTLTDHGVLLGSGTGAVSATTAGSAGQILRSGGAAADPAWSTATYPATVGINELLFGSTANGVTGLATANTGTLVTSSTGVPSWALGTTANRVLRTNGTAVSFGQVALTTDVTGTLPVANGGTGAATLTGYVKGTGTTAMTASATIPGADISGNITGSAANVTGTVAVANGGTGQTTAAAGFNALSPLTTLGDVLYGGASGAGTRLAGNTTTTKQFLSQTGNGTVSAAPVWSAIAASDVTNAVINGGNTGAVTVGTNNATSLTLETNSAAVMTILSGGNVGVGTASPSVQFDVQNVAGGRIRAGGAAGAGFEFNDANTRIAIPAANSMAFYSSNAERMRIDSSGNVGIGTTTPGQKLTVNGMIESQVGGIKFPDGSIQTTAGAGGSLYNYQAFTASGTWTKPAGLTGNEMVTIMVWGGGGGGGNNATGGSGGGGGACMVATVPASSLPASVTVTVGAGGAIQAAGGMSSFGDDITAYGGAGGFYYNSSTSGGGGGGGIFGVGTQASGGTGQGGGGPDGGASAGGTSIYGGGGGSSSGGPTGGRSVYGGGGGGHGGSSSGGISGGQSMYGGGGGGGLGAGVGGRSLAGGAGGNAGSPGNIPGGGGGGNAAGARGEVRVWVYK